MDTSLLMNCAYSSRLCDRSSLVSFRLFWNVDDGIFSILLLFKSKVYS
jgi:hypothetical protein